MNKIDKKLKFIIGIILATLIGTAFNFAYKMYWIKNNTIDTEAGRDYILKLAEKNQINPSTLNGGLMEELIRQDLIQSSINGAIIFILIYLILMTVIYLKPNIIIKLVEKIKDPSISKLIIKTISVSIIGGTCSFVIKKKWVYAILAKLSTGAIGESSYISKLSQKANLDYPLENTYKLSRAINKDIIQTSIKFAILCGIIYILIIKYKKRK